MPIKKAIKKSQEVQEKPYLNRDYQELAARGYCKDDIEEIMYRDEFAKLLDAMGITKNINETRTIFEKFMKRLMQRRVDKAFERRVEDKIGQLDQKFNQSMNQFKFNIETMARQVQMSVSSMQVGIEKLAAKVDLLEKRIKLSEAELHSYKVYVHELLQFKKMVLNSKLRKHLKED